jgi:hypothetical protein
MVSGNRSSGSLGINLGESLGEKMCVGNCFLKIMRKVDTFLSLALSTKGKTKQQTCWANRTFLSSDICLDLSPTSL